MNTCETIDTSDPAARAALIADWAGTLKLSAEKILDRMSATVTRAEAQLAALRHHVEERRQWAEK